MRTHQLLKSLRRVAAKELKNTRGVPENLRKSEKFELLAVAYGALSIQADFEKWCRENLSRHPRYPITDYIKVVDERLGESAVEEPKADLTDPRVKTLSAAIYDLTGFTPARKSVAELLAEYSEADILDAAKEYVETLDEKDFKKGMKAFFTDGGCAVVIYARTKRK